MNSYENLIAAYNLGKIDPGLGTILVPDLFDYGNDGAADTPAERHYTHHAAFDDKNNPADHPQIIHARHASGWRKVRLDLV